MFILKLGVLNQVLRMFNRKIEIGNIKSGFMNSMFICKIEVGSTKSGFTNVHCRIPPLTIVQHLIVYTFLYKSVNKFIITTIMMYDTCTFLNSMPLQSLMACMETSTYFHSSCLTSILVLISLRNSRSYGSPQIASLHLLASWSPRSTS